MNASRFHHWMSRLALLATLLLLTVPTTGRMLSPGSPVPTAATPGATVATLATPDHDAARSSPAHHAPPVAAPGQLPTRARHEECAYCPLLGSLALAVIPAVALVSQPPPLMARALSLPPRLPWRHPSGLGSRGPPTTL